MTSRLGGDYQYIQGDYTVDWSDEGEGISGEYDPHDPDDYPHLRASLSYRGVPVDKGSYCTLADAQIPAVILDIASRVLIEGVEERGGVELDGDTARFANGSRFMKIWTWIQYTDKGLEYPEAMNEQG